MINLNGVKRVLNKLGLSGRFIVLLTLLSCHVTIIITKTKTNNIHIMKQPKFRNKHTFELQPSDLEKVDKRSVTVPHEAYSVRELLEDFTTTSGYKVGERPGIYDDDPDHNTDISMHATDFDLTDEQKMAEDSQLTIEKAIEEKKASDKLAKETAEQQKIDAKVQETLDKKDAEKQSAKKDDKS